MTSSGEASRMRASWPSFLCEPLKRVAELSRSWLWLPSDADPPEACVEGNARGRRSTWGGQREEAGGGTAEAVAGAGPRRAEKRKARGIVRDSDAPPCPLRFLRPRRRSRSRRSWQRGRPRSGGRSPAPSWQRGRLTGRR